MKKVMSLLFALVLVVSCMSVKMPVEAVGEEVTSLQNGYSDVLFSNGYRGFCLDRDESGAYANDDKYTVAKGSLAFSNIDEKNISQNIKKLLVCCFEDVFEKGDTGYTIKNTNNIQAVIWNYTEGQYIWGEQITLQNKVEAIGAMDIPDDGYQIVTSYGDIVTFHFIVIQPQKEGVQDFFAYKLDVTPASAGQVEEISVTGGMKWDEESNPDNVRPESVTINLFADGEKVDSKEVTASDDWKWDFTELPKYKDGVEILYTITAEELEGFITEVDGYNVIATYVTNNPVIPETVSATITLILNDSDNQDGKRPVSVEATLNDGAAAVTLNEANNWTATVQNLPKTDSEGSEIEYTWTVTGLPTGYALSDTSIEDTLTTLTYNYTPETITVNGCMEWDEESNPDNVRPESVTINLFADDEKVDSKEVTAADDWKWDFTELPKYKAASEITYKISVEEIDKFATEVDGYNVIATYISDIPETVSATISLVWDDADDQDGKRPESLIATLSDGTEVTLNVANNWTATVDNLPKNDEAGEEIAYTWVVNEPDGYMLTDSVERAETTVTCSYIPETTVVDVSVIWSDSDNQDNKRPESITIELLANGEKVDEEKVSVENNWKWKFTNLPKYEAGEEIIYTIEEVQIDGYVVEIDEYDVIATYKPTDTGNSGEGIPGEPDNPDDSGNQGTTENPDNSGEGEKEVSPDTGDYNNIFCYLIMFVAASMAIIQRVLACAKQK